MNGILCENNVYFKSEISISAYIHTNVRALHLSEFNGYFGVVIVTRGKIYTVFFSLFAIIYYQQLTIVKYRVCLNARSMSYVCFFETLRDEQNRGSCNQCSFVAASLAIRIFMYAVFLAHLSAHRVFYCK